MRAAGERWLAPAVFCLALGVGAAAFALDGRGNRPPVPGDGQDYDNIALNLRHGRGFGQYWDDPEWRAPYEANNQSDLYTGILARRGGYAPTAYRPPLLPLAVAGAYLVFGRSFLAWGLIHCGIVALMIALSVALARRALGLAPAMIALLFLLADPSLRAATFLSPYLTEGLTCLGVVLFVRSLARIARGEGAGRRTIAFAASGAALGACVLVRTIFIFWYPPALLLVWWLARGPSKGAGDEGRSQAGALRAVAAFLALAVLVPLPLWTRNCLVLGGLMPLGTQGGRNLPMGWSDEAVANGGVWTSETSRSWWAIHGAGTEIGDPLTVEKTQAAVGQRAALGWIGAHPLDVPGLALGKLVDLWRRPLPGRYGWALALAALVGLPATWRRREVVVLWAILLFESLAVMATYSDGSRFLIPVVPVLDLLVALGLWRLVTGLGLTLPRRAGSGGR